METKKGNETKKREERRTDNRALVSWRKLNCRWLGILLSSHTSPPIPKALSLISLSSHFSLHFSFMFFPPIPLFYHSLQFPFIVYLTPFSAPPSLSAPHFPPCSCLSLQSKHVAMNSGSELCTLRSHSNPWPEESRSLFLYFITPSASGYDTLEEVFTTVHTIIM